MNSKSTDLPIVYSCSGCSSAAQMANHVALELDKRGVAQMSCIAGVGGDVPSLVKIAKSGRPIIALDGCPLACAKSCLARHGVEPDSYHQLNQYGVKKRFHAEFDRDQAETVIARVLVEQAGDNSGHRSKVAQRKHGRAGPDADDCPDVVPAAHGGIGSPAVQTDSSF